LWFHLFSNTAKSFVLAGRKHGILLILRFLEPKKCVRYGTYPRPVFQIRIDPVTDPDIALDECGSGSSAKSDPDPVRIRNRIPVKFEPSFPKVNKTGFLKKI
jgi:hypothetical protein